MPRLLHPNLMFEDELDGTAHQVPAMARKSAGQLAAVMGLLVSSSASASHQDDIVIVNEDAVPAEIPSALQHVRFETLASLSRMDLAKFEFQPWGWSKAAISLGTKLGLKFAAPDPDVVRFVNSREFLAPLDGCWPLSKETESAKLPGGRLCWSAAEVSESLREFAELGLRKWVIKSNFSQASRNRVCGDGIAISATTQNWLRKRFADKQPVYVEPWFERVAECGLQFAVSPSSSDQSIEYIGGCEMLTDDSGRYRGSIVSTAIDGWWQSAIAPCTKVAAAAQQLGFFGPIGMDCMLVRHPINGTLWLRPCHDVNGRYTMGRVALSLRHWLQPGEIGFWCHGVEKSDTAARNLFVDQPGEDVRIIPTSPAMYGSERTTFQTALLISADCCRLETVVSKILSQNIRGPFDPLNISDLSTAANEKFSP
jgi:hypothetical protein